MKTLFAIVLISLLPAQTQSLLVSQGPTHVRAVALTFDAGADRGFAAQILQTLERYHIHASFGMTGRWAEQNPDLIRRMHRDGDAFINHTYDHRSFTGFSSQTAALTSAQRTWEVTQTDRVLMRLTSTTTKPYFRPPYGDYDQATLSLVRQLGYTKTIMWTVDSLGWERISRTAIVSRCITRMAPGDIYLMHVGSQSQDAFALPALIQALLHARYRILTIPQLLKAH